MQKEAHALLALLLVLFMALIETAPVSALIIRYYTGDEIDSVAISWDGSYMVASAGSGQHLYLLDREGNLIWKQNFTSRPDEVAISSDGDFIALELGGSLCLLKGAETLWSKEFESSNLWHVAISGNGERIGAIVENYDTGKVFIRMLNRQGQELWTYDIGDEGVLASISISSQGELTAYCCFDDNIYLLDSSGELIREFQASPGSSISHMSMSPDGNYVGVYSSGLCLFDTSGQTIWKGGSETWGSKYVSISANGEVLAAYDSPNIVAYNKAGSQLWAYKVGEDVEDVAISNDGGHVVAGTRSGLIYILENPPGEVVVDKPAVKPSQISCLTDSPCLIGAKLSTSGQIEPSHSYVNVTLTFESPSGKILTVTTLTFENGSFRCVFAPNELGNWKLNASWTGDEDHLGAQGSTSFLVELVEVRRETQILRIDDLVTLEVGEKRHFTTHDTGSGMWYDYRVVTCPDFMSYKGSYTYVIGGDDYISSTLSAMPYAKVGTYQILAEYGWSSAPYGTVSYDYKLSFRVEIIPPAQKYNTVVNITNVSQGLLSIDVKGVISIDLNGYPVGFPDAELNLAFTKPDGSIFVQTTKSDKNGNFRYSFMPSETGSWSVVAEWSGDSVRNGYKSASYSFNMLYSPMIVLVSLTIIIIIVLVIVITVVFLVRRKRRAKEQAPLAPSLPPSSPPPLSV